MLPDCSDVTSLQFAGSFSRSNNGFVLASWTVSRLEPLHAVLDADFVDILPLRPWLEMALPIDFQNNIITR